MRVTVNLQTLSSSEHLKSHRAQKNPAAVRARSPINILFPADIEKNMVHCGTNQMNVIILSRNHPSSCVCSERLSRIKTVHMMDVMSLLNDVIDSVIIGKNVTE